MGDVLHTAGDGDAGEHHGLGFGVLWEADVGCVQGPHLFPGTSWPAESLLSWGSRKTSKCLPRCLQVLGGQGGILLFVPATSLLAPCPTKPCSCILGKVG